MKNLLFYLATLNILIGCQANSGEVQKKHNSQFEKGQELGKVPDFIDEASGLEMSISNKGTMWTHNDSGGQPVIFLINEKAELQATITLEGVENRDWEDIAVGPGPKVGKNYIYISETGDNNAVHKTKYIYRVEEPLLDLSGEEPVTLTISEVVQISFNYPDGKRDAETLLIDPNTKDLYIVSKREANVNVYVAKYPQLTDQVNILTKLGSLPFHNVVAGDISMKNEILLKTYDNVYYWKGEENESLYQILSNTPIILPYKPEPQGESITWDSAGSGYFTLSEKNGSENPDLLYYKRN